MSDRVRVGGESGHSAWYPVIFPEKCDGCQAAGTPKCIEFCQYSVLALIERKAIVTNPQNCAHGRVACRPLCPRGAIEFPHDPGLIQITEKAWTEVLRRTVCSRCGKVFLSDGGEDLCGSCKRGDRIHKEA